jgi:tyrosinase-like protein
MAPFVRVDVWSLAPDDPILTYYARVVGRMQARPPSDVTSWAYQAAIHGKDDPAPLPLWNECRHEGWFFLSWHRAYVYYFERIVRGEVVAAGGPKDWALPYWNYDGGGSRNTLPMAFRSPTLSDGSANPLYVPGRTLTGRAELPLEATSPAFAMKRTIFTGESEFGGGKTGPMSRFAGLTGRLEQTPHNDIHNLIGGFMLDPDQAAQDPIFWLHHCNIDRLWWLWQKTNTNPSATAWTTPTFSFFDVGGTSGTKAGGDVENTVTQLDYTYVSVPQAWLPPADKVVSVQWPTPWPKPGGRTSARVKVEPNLGAVREMVGATSTSVKLIGAPVRVTVSIDRRATESLERILPAEVRQHRAFLEIENVDAKRNPGAVYGVYLNLPETPTDHDLDTHHVGNVSLFGIERAKNPRGDAHPHAMRFSMEITEVLNHLAARKAWRNGAQLDVSFRPLTVRPDPESAASIARVAELSAHPNIPIEIGRISVHYE